MWSCHLSSLVIFIVTITSITQANNSDCAEGWQYHRHTHACYKYMFPVDKETWSVARDACRTHKGGITMSRPGHLARIDDEVTNTFVQGLVGSATWKTWIGLYYSNTLNEYRWDGYALEKPEFFNFASNLPASKTEYPFVYITSYKWNLHEPSIVRPCICQHDAFTSGIELSCPFPVRENTTPDKPITCQFLFNFWSSASISAKTNENPVGSCSKEGNTCNAGDGYNMNIQDVNDDTEMSLAFTSNVTRQNEGSWICSISKGDRSLESKSCQLQVYEPPASVSCNIHLSPRSITIVCIADEIYPRAVCDWSHTYQEDSNFDNIFNSSAKMTTTHTERLVGGQQYFISNCSLSLTAEENAKINPGVFSVQVQVYPDLTVSDFSFLDRIGTTVNASARIEPPKEPEFQFPDATVTGSSVVYQQNDTVELKCEISQGKPGVESTSVSCDFPISQSGEWTQESTGNVHLLNTPATVDMGGKTCVCWGKHLTGVTQNTSVTFQVLYTARVMNFTVNTEDKAAFDPLDEVSLECLAKGNPLPSMDIYKVNSLQNDQRLVTYQEKGISTTNFSAQCTDNGRYQCRVHNMVTGQIYHHVEDVIVRVKCSLMFCAGEDKKNLEVTTGEKAVLSVCAVAYPAPDVSDFLLQKDNGQGWTSYTLRQKDSIELVLNSDVLESVVITLSDVPESDIGDYKLSYRGGLNNSTDETLIQFRITAKPVPDSDSSSPVIPIVVTLVVIVFIVVVVVVVILIRRRRSRKEEDGKQNGGGDKGLQDGVTYTNPILRDEEDAKPSTRATGNESTYSNVSLVIRDEGEGPSESDTDVKTAVEGEGELYQNVGAVAPTDESPQDDGGLVYVTVDFDQHKNDNSVKESQSSDTQATTSGESESPKTKNDEEKVKSEVKDEPTEYTLISETATQKMKEVIGAAGDENKDGEEEESIYQNS